MRISDWSSDVCSSDLLTLGSHRVVKTTAADGLTDDEVLRVAASVQRDAEHPIAQALMTSAKEHGIDVPMSQDFESMPGRGVRAVVEERSLHVGGPGLLRMLAVEPPERSEEHTSELQSLMRISYAVFCLKKKKTTPQS